ncbi:MAG: ComF family protein [Acetobacteraceae bacterium]|nr:ComF family protein [Acetobacteraceae bacterium]MCX7684069.1 ComF family protein [Acetobacteraceae bacterium]MDW8399898.1 ComF family protein [Acetobacteraceae bacterium]
MRLSAPGEGPALRRLAAGVRRAAGFVLDSLLPPLCLSCRVPVLAAGAQCPDCARGLNPPGGFLCHRCGVPLGGGLLAERVEGRLLCPGCHAAPPDYGQARAALLYDEGAKPLILALKHGRRTDLARWLARRMAAAAPDLLARAEAVVPVPLHWRRLLARGYNQSGLMAAHLARAAGLPLLPRALRRLRATPPLGARSAAERARVLEGVFAVAPRAVPRIAGRRVLLVDDVLTSGATASACARALLSAGAAGVDVLAAARVPDPRIEALDGGGRA